MADFYKKVTIDSSGIELTTTDDGLLKVSSTPSPAHQVDFNVTNELLSEIISQIKILNIHMSSITGLEDLQEDSGDQIV